MRVIAFTQETPVHRYVFYCLHHSAYIKYTWCASSSISPICRTSPTSYHITYTTTDGIDVLLWRDHVHMGIKVAWCTDGMFTCSSFRTCRNYHIAIYVVHRVGIPRFSNPSYLAVLYTYISLYYTKD